MQRSVQHVMKENEKYNPVKERKNLKRCSIIAISFLGGNFLHRTSITPRKPFPLTEKANSRLCVCAETRKKKIWYWEKKRWWMRSMDDGKRESQESDAREEKKKLQIQLISLIVLCREMLWNAKIKNKRKNSYRCSPGSTKEEEAFPFRNKCRLNLNLDKMTRLARHGSRRALNLPQNTPCEDGTGREKRRFARLRIARSGFDEYFGGD